MVQLIKRKSANLQQSVICYLMADAGIYLCVSRISVEHIRKEFACTSDAGYDETVNVEAVNNEKVRQVVRVGFEVLLWGRRWLRLTDWRLCRFAQRTGGRRGRGLDRRATLVLRVRKRCRRSASIGFSVCTSQGLLVRLLQAEDWACVDLFGHPIEIHQEA